LDPNLRATVYGLVAKYCDDHVLADFIRLYEKETLQEEKVRLLNAMGRFSTPAVLYSVLDYAFNSGKVRSGDFFYVLGGLASHAKGRRAAWFFLKDNWTKVSERYSGGGLKLLSRVVALTCDGFARYQDADDIEVFFKENPAPSATRAIAESLERIRVRAAWYERAKTDLDATLPLLAGPSSGSPLVGC
jgi:aminopeptidase N